MGEVVVAMGLFAWSSVPSIPLFFTAIFLLLGFYMIASGLFKRWLFEMCRSILSTC